MTRAGSEWGSSLVVEETSELGAARRAVHRLTAALEAQHGRRSRPYGVAFAVLLTLDRLAVELAEAKIRAEAEEERGPRIMKPRTGRPEQVFD